VGSIVLRMHLNQMLLQWDQALLLSLHQAIIRTEAAPLFSSPIIAGMAACLVGIFPDSSASSIIQMIRRAETYIPSQRFLRYGIPDFWKIN